MAAKETTEVNVNTISINGEEYVKASEKAPSSSDVQIVILQRGWVMVGHFSQDGENCLLERASVIRIFGTTKGLGELALSGPTSKTVLDPCGTVQFNVLTMIARIGVTGKWAL